MKKFHVILWDKDEKPISIDENEHMKLLKIINSAKFVQLKGNTYAVSDIKRIKQAKEEPIYLPIPEPKPIAKSFIEKLRAEWSQRFNWIKP